jgi:L-ascorbate metabolism protein UlaG (beta-lactamase superfamily)
MQTRDATPASPPTAALPPASGGLLRQLLFPNGYRGPVSDHFDGTRFRNLDLPQPHGLLGFLRWRLGRWLGGVGPWARWTDAPPGPAPAARVEGAALRVTFVGHATILLQTAGLNVLTDPIWSDRASPFAWGGPHRRRPPGLRFSDLPPIDAVLLSHNHYDHLDLPTLRALARDHAPRFVAGLGNGGLLASQRIGPVTEMDWWQEMELAGGLRLTCVPARHFSSRGLRDRNRTLWCGYVLHGADGPVTFAGDTAFGSHFAEVARRFGPSRLALLPIGGYRPLWFMGRVHQTPAEAVRAHTVLGARTSLAIHFGTFPLADEGEGEPEAELASALRGAPEIAPHFWVLRPGEGRDVP